MKRARIIYNPTSGRELFKKNLPQVLQNLNKLAMKLLVMRRHVQEMPRKQQKKPHREILI